MQGLVGRKVSRWVKVLCVQCEQVADSIEVLAPIDPPQHGLSVGTTAGALVLLDRRGQPFCDRLLFGRPGLRRVFWWHLG